jgi:hypothetical protein
VGQCNLSLLQEMQWVEQNWQEWNTTGQSGLLLAPGFVVIGYPSSHYSWVVGLALGLLVITGMTATALDIWLSSLPLTRFHVGKLLLHVIHGLLYFINVVGEELIYYQDGFPDNRKDLVNVVDYYLKGTVGEVIKSLLNGQFVDICHNGTIVVGDPLINRVITNRARGHCRQMVGVECVGFCDR